MTPLLILLGIPAAVAVATEANQIAASSFSGVLAHLKRRAVDFKMGNILVVGGLLGSAVGVEVFRIIKSYGQIELFVSLCYILFLGSIGTLMFLESLSTIQKSRKSENTFKQKKKHNWIHGLPFKTKFKSSNLYISAIPPVIIGFIIGILASNNGSRRRFHTDTCNDLHFRHAYQSRNRHLTLSDNVHHSLHHLHACYAK